MLVSFLLSREGERTGAESDLCFPVRFCLDACFLILATHFNKQYLSIFMFLKPIFWEIGVLTGNEEMLKPI